MAILSIKICLSASPFCLATNRERVYAKAFQTYELKSTNKWKQITIKQYNKYKSLQFYVIVVYILLYFTRCCCCSFCDWPKSDLIKMFCFKLSIVQSPVFFLSFSHIFHRKISFAHVMWVSLRVIKVAWKMWQWKLRLKLINAHVYSWWKVDRMNKLANNVTRSERNIFWIVFFLSTPSGIILRKIMILFTISH